MEDNDLLSKCIDNIKMFDYKVESTFDRTKLSAIEIENTENNMNIQFPVILKELYMCLNDGGFSLSPWIAIGIKNGISINGMHVSDIYFNYIKMNFSNGNKNWFMFDEKIVDKYPEFLVPVLLGHDWEMACIYCDGVSFPVYFFNPADVLFVENEIVVIVKVCNSFSEFLNNYLDGIDMYEVARTKLNDFYDVRGYPLVNK